jgi:hypothetical protein
MEEYKHLIKRNVMVTFIRNGKARPEPFIGTLVSIEESKEIKDRNKSNAIVLKMSQEVGRKEPKITSLYLHNIENVRING